MFLSLQTLVLVSVGAVVTTTPPAAGQADWYVSSSGSDSNDGESWGTAFETIQKAVDRAILLGDYEIWVEEGTYVLSSPLTIPWTGSKIGLMILGGFEGDETTLSQRDWGAHTSILDGNNTLGSVIVVDRWVDLIDGFTITGGTALGVPSGRGGAIDIRGCGNLSPQPVLRNLVIRGNGGDTTHPPISYEGGGIYIEDCSPWIINSSFSNNRVWAHGGAVFARDSDDTPIDTYPIIVSSTFTENHSDVNGGAVGVYRGTMTILNSILWGDTAGDGATHEVFGGTLSIMSSDIDPAQPGFAGVNGNIQEDPKLAGVARFHLLPGSPCIDAGNDLLWTTFVDGFEEDFDGDDRFLDGGSGVPTIDMGADEFVPGVSKLFHVTIDGDDAKSGLDWENALATLQEAVNKGVGFDTEIWVKQGTYDLTDHLTLTPASKNVGIYGGFAGTETARSQRGTDPALTVVDGMLLYNSLALDWTAAPGRAGLVVDGLTLTRGPVRLNYANEVRLSNCHITNSTGGGILFGNSDLVIDDCRFENNTAVTFAGAVAGGNASLTITDSVFIGNSSTGASAQGGAVTVTNGTIERCSFFGNHSAKWGGAIFHNGSDLIIRNSQFSGNTASIGAAISKDGGTVEIVNSTFSGNTSSSGSAVNRATSITNSILFGNPPRNTNLACTSEAVTYSAVGDPGYDDVTGCQMLYGNTDADPLLVDPDGADSTLGTVDDDLSLQPGSPVIDAGSSEVQLFGSIDIVRNPRHIDDPLVDPDPGYGPPPMIDMGAFERQASTPEPSYDLTMASVGSGTTTPPVGVHNYPTDSVIGVTATADPGWIFTGWTGWVVDATAASTSVTMNWDRTVMANFAEAYLVAVDVQGDGTGTITSSPVGINCPGDCSEIFEVGTDVALTADVDDGTVFDGWVSSECEGIDDCDLTVNQDVSVAAMCNLEGACGLGDAMTLDNMSIDWTHVFESCSSITTGSGFAIVSPGEVLFRAGTSAALRDGFSLGLGALFSVELYADVGLVPSIVVSKVADPVTAASGDPITYTISVDNNGEVPLTEVSIVDAKCDAAPVFHSGDDGDGELEVGETWVYECFGVAEAITFTNTAVATFEDALGDEVSDSGTAEVIVALTGCDGGARFADLSNGTIYDCWTDLIWLKDANCVTLPHTDGTWGAATWDNAILSAGALSNGTCGLSDGSSAGDWRLPTGSEFCGTWGEFDPYPYVCDEALGLINDNFTPPLSNTVGDGPWVEGDPFVGVLTSSGYWTATEVSWDNSLAWRAFVGTANLSHNAKTYEWGYVWPVRTAP